MNYIAVSVSILLCVSVVEISMRSKTKTYSALNSIIFSELPEPAEDVHSEYYFGKCAILMKSLVLHERLYSIQIRGHAIIRGHLNITKGSIPNCVYIKASSPHGDMVRYNPYKFTVCFKRVVILYLAMIVEYFYYEWFVPIEMQEGINWDLYFYTS